MEELINNTAKFLAENIEKIPQSDWEDFIKGGLIGFVNKLKNEAPVS